MKIHQRIFLKKETNAGAARQLWHFILHLRWHYQLFILSGGFLLGGFLSPHLDAYWFVLQFLNVHLLLFGGATAYNSYWDKDEGPIGGLRNPPKMTPWMWMASLLLQMIGLLLAIPMGSLFILIYCLSMVLFWLYSTPHARWKSRPIKSLVAIGLSTGFNSVLLGYLAAGNQGVPLPVLVAALGVTFILLSLYPVSQIYQREEDSRRGDQTFAVQYGASGVRWFFETAYAAGLLLVTTAFIIQHTYLGILFGIIGGVAGAMARSTIRNLTAGEEDYKRVMKMKYGTSLSFVAFLLIVILLKHVEIDGISAVADLLLR